MRASFASSSVNSTRGAAHARRAIQVLARWRVPRAVLLCLIALIPVRAAMASNGSADPSGPRGESSQGWYGFEVVPMLSLPLAAGSAHRDEIGMTVGLTLTAKPSPVVGIGVDLAYHYWPVSAHFKQEFNEMLRGRTWNTLMLGGGTWVLHVAQMGGHFRVATPAARGPRAWLQVGAGSYRVDPNTSGYSGDAGFFTVVVPPLKHTQHVGLSVVAGADLFGGPRGRMGVDANYHFVNCRDLYGQDLQVFTLGVHVLFGFHVVPPAETSLAEGAGVP